MLLRAIGLAKAPMPGAPPTSVTVTPFQSSVADCARTPASPQFETTQGHYLGVIPVMPQAPAIPT
jgi:hypothetical protein